MVLSMVTDDHRRHEEFRLRPLPPEGMHSRSMISLPLGHSSLVRRAMEVAANRVQILTSPTLSNMLALDVYSMGDVWNDSALSVL